MTHDCVKKKRKKKEKKETRLSYKKGDVAHHIKHGGVWAALNGCKWVFLHCDAWHPIFPHRQKHMDSIPSLPCCFIYMIVSRLVFFRPPWLDIPARLAVRVLRWKTLRLKGAEINTLCKLFHTRCVGLHRKPCVLSIKQGRLAFPLSPLSYIQMGRIFFFFFLLCNKT